MQRRMPRAVLVAILLAVLVLGVTAARADETAPAAQAVVPPVAAAAADSRPAGWVDWNGDNFFGNCEGDCSLAILGGREIRTGLSKILGPKISPGDWKWGPSGFVSAIFSRRLVTFWNALEIDPEVGAGKRFGADAKAAEFWGAIGIYWLAFPWSNYLGTKVGVAEGFDIATQIDEGERIRSLPGRTGSVLLNYFSPEIDFSLPQAPAFEMVFRINHRSGIYGLINHVNGGIQYGEAGLRVHF
jgi:hypothetical protein